MFLGTRRVDNIQAWDTQHSYTARNTAQHNTEKQTMCCSESWENEVENGTGKSVVLHLRVLEVGDGLFLVSHLR